MQKHERWVELYTLRRAVSLGEQQGLARNRASAWFYFKRTAWRSVRRSVLLGGRLTELLKNKNNIHVVTSLVDTNCKNAALRTACCV